MPNLAAFAELARKVGAVPLVPPASEPWGTDRGTDNSVIIQCVSEHVPLVPHVPPQDDEGWDDEDWQAAFDERAGILEFDADLPRNEAERLAAIEVEAMKPLDLNDTRAVDKWVRKHFGVPDPLEYFDDPSIFE